MVNALTLESVTMWQLISAVLKLQYQADAVKMHSLVHP